MARLEEGWPKAQAPKARTRERAETERMKEYLFKRSSVQPRTKVDYMIGPQKSSVSDRNALIEKLARAYAPAVGPEPASAPLLPGRLFRTAVREEAAPHPEADKRCCAARVGVTHRHFQESQSNFARWPRSSCEVANPGGGRASRPPPPRQNPRPRAGC